MHRLGARESRSAARRSLGKSSSWTAAYGRDCEIEVGKSLPGGESVVVAILDHRRERVFDVHTASRGQDGVRVGRHGHAVTEFA
jgi:hypothetical protein